MMVYRRGKKTNMISTPRTLKATKTYTQMYIYLSIPHIFIIKEFVDWWLTYCTEWDNSSFIHVHLQSSHYSCEFDKSYDPFTWIIGVVVVNNDNKSKNNNNNDFSFCSYYHSIIVLCPMVLRGTLHKFPTPNDNTKAPVTLFTRLYQVLHVYCSYPPHTSWEPISLLHLQVDKTKFRDL